MKLGELRKLTNGLSDDFDIEITATTGFSRFGIDMEHLLDISVDIGHSDKVVHFFGELESARSYTDDKERT